jgi:peptide/nickel transport system permease protein
MRNFVLTRVGAMIVILIALIAVMFVLQHISPMDPVKAQLGGTRSGWTSRCSTSSGTT